MSLKSIVTVPVGSGSMPEYGASGSGRACPVGPGFGSRPGTVLTPEALLPHPATRPAPPSRRAVAGTRESAVAVDGTSRAPTRAVASVATRTSARELHG